MIVQLQVTDGMIAYLRMPRCNETAPVGHRTRLVELLGPYAGPYVTLDLNSAGALVGIEVVDPSRDHDQTWGEGDLVQGMGSSGEDGAGRISKFVFEVTGATTAYLRLPTCPEKLRGARSVTLSNLMGAYEGPYVVFDFDQEGILVGIEIVGDDPEEDGDDCEGVNG